MYFENFNGSQMADEVFRRLLGTDIGNLSPMERLELEYIIDAFHVEHEIIDGKIREILTDLSIELNNADSSEVQNQ